jgi:membrane-anchored protein YejM (alkaline phosphatase superfamily)
VLRGPGVPAGVETRPTSHLDVVPTILELAGARPSGRAGYALGASLLDPPAERRRVVAGWDELALWAPGGILRLPLEAHGGGIDAYDYAWRPLQDDALIDAEGRALLELAQECRRFLR